MNTVTTTYQAFQATTRMKAHTGLAWHVISWRLRDLAGTAKTGRALARLVPMAVYAEIQAEIGINISQVEGDRQWAAYCRKVA